MALSAKKLYYRKGTTTYSCNLYTSTGDFSQTTYISLRVPGSPNPETVYAPVGSISDGRASHLRIYKNGTTQAIFTAAIRYVSTWTTFGSQNHNSSSTTSSSYSVSVDNNVLYSSSVLFNIRISWSVSASASTPINPYVRIDGTLYSYGSDVTTGTVTRDFRLSTGSHTIILYGHYQDTGEYSSNSFSTTGYRVVP